MYFCKDGPYLNCTNYKKIISEFNYNFFKNNFTFIYSIIFFKTKCVGQYQLDNNYSLLFYLAYYLVYHVLYLYQINFFMYLILD